MAAKAFSPGRGNGLYANNEKRLDSTKESSLFSFAQTHAALDGKNGARPAKKRVKRKPDGDDLLPGSVGHIDILGSKVNRRREFPHLPGNLLPGAVCHILTQYYELRRVDTEKQPVVSFASITRFSSR